MSEAEYFNGLKSRVTLNSDELRMIWMMIRRVEPDDVDMPTCNKLWKKIENNLREVK
jgi:hypothetical protein